MPNSMTGFARQEKQADWGTLSCEIRSVNQRYLEPSIRLPEALRSLEPMVREECRKRLQRGKIEITLQLSLSATQSTQLSINKALVAQLAKATADITEAIENAHPIAPINPLQVLQWPGVVEQHHLDMEMITAEAETLFSKTLSLLVEHRQREGVELQNQIEQRLAAISDYINSLHQQMPAILLAQKEKLQQRLLDLQANIDEERLAQEIAILANKADIDEELDRLEIHIAEVKHILVQTGAVGRRLDFMMQELNREANTLSSKAIHTDTTQAAVSLKVLIEQMREQIQNIE